MQRGGNVIFRKRSTRICSRCGFKNLTTANRGWKRGFNHGVNRVWQQRKMQRGF